MLRDWRFAARIVRRRPGLAAVAVLTLALGIGATTSMFSVVQRVVLAPLPFSQPRQLVMIREHMARSGLMNVSWPDYLDWRHQAHSFSALAAFQPAYPDTMHLPNGSQATTRVASVTGSLFPLLGLHFALGRGFTRAEEQPGVQAAMVIGYRFWRRQMGGDPHVIGKSYYGSPPIMGVLRKNPPDMPWSAELYVPLGPEAANPSFASRGNHPGLLVLGRIKPGVTFPAARANLGLVMDRLAAAYPATNQGETAAVKGLGEFLNGSYRPELWLLLGAVGLVLLLACANLAHLLLAQASARTREYAIRHAVGASRRDLLRQSACETLVIAILGGGAGLLLAWWAIPVLVRWAPYPVPRMDGAHLNGPVVAFAVGVALLSALLAGLAPALEVARGSLNARMKAVSGGRVHGGLLAAEVALAVTVVGAASLLGRSLQRVLAVNPGFNVNRLITLPIAHGNKGAQAYFEQTLAHLRALPGVAAASAVMEPPLHGAHWTTPYLVGGQPAPPPAERPWSLLNMAEPGYFRTIQAHLIAGRYFTPSDGMHTPLVAILNQTMARMIAPDGHAIGLRIFIQDDHQWRTVVGVVGDLRQFSLSQPAGAEIFVPVTQYPALDYVSLVVRTRGSPASVMHALAAIPSWSLPGLMTTVLSHTLVRRRFLSLLMAGFGLLALLLAALGIYAITAHRVAARTRELGVRLALGATRGRLLRGVLASNLRPMALGLALGLAGAFGAGRLWAHWLFGVGAANPLALAGACGLLVAVTFAACLGPALRAARTDPMGTLRTE
ncbi:MAG: ADOP family duplicated permease [Terriglobales bacterium]